MPQRDVPTQNRARERLKRIIPKFSRPVDLNLDCELDYTPPVTLHHGLRRDAARAEKSARIVATNCNQLFRLLSRSRPAAVLDRGFLA